MDLGTFSSTEHNKALQDAILRTVAFFDLFDYPLTAWEIWKFGLFEERTELPAVMAALERDDLSGKISRQNSFYFLVSREMLLDLRLARYNETDRKMKRTLAVAKLFRLIPWIKMIAVSNVIGSHNMKAESDIDLFIIAAEGRLWLTRFCCTALAKLLRLRPTENRTRDTICLNFYVSEQALDLERLRLESDIYLPFWITNLIPIYNLDDTYENFIAANRWLDRLLPNWLPGSLPARRSLASRPNRSWHRAIDSLFGRFEAKCKNFQLKILPPELKNRMNRGSEVVLNDQMLKLHHKDRRSEYSVAWREKTANI